MIDPEDWPFSPEEIAETRGIISQTLKGQGFRMEEEQLDVAMRRLLLQDGNPAEVGEEESLSMPADEEDGAQNKTSTPPLGDGSSRERVAGVYWKRPETQARRAR